MIRWNVLAIGFVVLFGSATAVGVVADHGVDVTVSEVEVTPDPVESDEEFTVRVAIENLQTSDQYVQIDHVELKNESDDSTAETLDSVSPPGSIRPDSSKTVELEGELEEDGVQDLFVQVSGTTEDGERVHVTYPFELRVGEEHPQLDIDVDDAIANAETPVTVSLANGIDENLRNVRLSLEGDDVSFEGDQHVRSNLASGEEETVEYAAIASKAGEQRLTATLRYTAEDGERRTVRERRDVSFDELKDTVELDASSADDGSSISVTMTNRGNVPVEDIVISETHSNVSASNAPIDRIDPKSSRTVTLNVSTIDADGSIDVPVSASYSIGDLDRESETSTQLSDSPGKIDLTGIEIEEEDGKIRVSGSASNVGLSEAQSVVVRVVDTANVTPAQPNREYFVGSVPESDFVSFDVYARTAGDVEEIPIEVTYLVDGDEQTHEFTVSDDAVSETRESQSDAQGLLIPAVGGGGLILLVGVAMAVSWRNSRGGT